MLVTAGQTFNILVVDDDEDDFFITSSLLAEVSEYDFKVSWCPSYKGALAQLQTNLYNLVLADYRLGGKTGADLIEEAIQNGIDIPIILLTGKGNVEIDKNAMDRGAYDYLLKSDINPQSLERSIRYAFTRYKSLKAVQKSENKYRAMFENSKDAMFTLNEKLEVVDINDVAITIIGLEKTQVTGEAFYKLFKNEIEIKEILLEVDEYNELIDEEIMLQILDGNERQGLLTLTCEKDAEAKRYYQGVFHDITELKKAEQSNLLAEKFEATQRFVKMLAHEIRNPLNNILLSIDNLNTFDYSNKDVYIDIVKRNSLRINDLIGKLLESFKIVDIELERVNFKDLIQDALVSIYDRLTLKGVVMKKQINELVTIKADEERLKLALVNFFVNAIEAMEENKGILLITVVEKQSTIDLIIRDNGCGMDESQQQRLFEPYFTTKKTGVGLGLSSAMAILRSHNATVEIESEVNKGTAFTIGFPKSKF
ncbi:ATP-binding protein [Parasediminibacterium sp. JCM 36343]|uniref:hybrid sensor histidine kinase/response regulator n=1 Tax=Parasediminibacterium sp. JCM 36343 TaxID=3374279 RepID=UPI00397A2B32